MCPGSVNDSILDKLRDENIDFIPKNPYLKKAKELNNILFSINEIAQNFKTIFDNNNLPIVIEIGTYMGQTLIELAISNPHINFIGIDIVFKRVVKTSEKIKIQKIPNAKMVIGDGLKLLNIIPENSISGICVFFPDPWEKKHKKRLINENFFLKSNELLKKNGFLWLKTDHKDYFESYKNLIDYKAFIPLKKLPNMLNEKKYPTYFETLFNNQNKIIYETVLQKTMDFRARV